MARSRTTNYSRFQRCTVGMEIQSVLFPREHFSEREASKWARSHGFITSKIDETDNFYRFRQRLPNEFKPGSFRIITLGNTGVKAIVACPKPGKETDKRKVSHDRADVHEAIREFRQIPKSGRGYERARRLRQSIRK